ncbi:MAG: hemerythrin domain-containing protein [Labilithrix sp.]|nr:hemerythrin domain-containing protein [Labilithrix sp.]MBX3222545.1 hemerythrin domain-containing protein [Labilithrix sp.]
MAHPLQELAHDHRELSGLLLAVRDALARVERGQSRLDDELHEIRDGIEVFREALLEHFAREQEGLLPFVVTRLPSVSARVDQLIAEHDRIAEALTALVRDLGAVDAGGAVDALRASLGRFEELYASHSKAELGFLTEVAEALAGDAAATEELRTLLDEP